MLASTAIEYTIMLLDTILGFTFSQSFGIEMLVICMTPESVI